MGELNSFSTIAPFLSNPLILVGFALLLAFGIHRALIRSGILSPLTARQSSLVVRLILRYGFLIALAVLTLGFGYVFFTTYLTRITEKRTALTLVDLVVEEDLAFDFKLKNSGTDTAFLTDVKFVFYPGSGVLSSCMPVWHTLYDFPFTAQLGDQLVAVAEGVRLSDAYSLPAEAKAYAHEKRFVGNENAQPYLVTKPLKISQAVPPAGVDRFKVRFVIDPKYSNAFFAGGDRCRWAEVYEAVAVITYDGGKTLTSGKFQIGYVPSQHVGRPAEGPTKGQLPNKGMEPTR